MIKLSIIFIFLLISISQQNNAYSQPMRNIDIMDSLAMETAKSLCVDLKNTGISKFSLDVISAQGDWMLRRSITSAAPLYGLSIYDANNQSDKVELNIRKLSIEYEDNGDFLRRKISLTVGGIKKLHSGELSSLRVYEYEYEDTFKRDDLKSVEDSPYDFARTQPPPRKKSFWDSILEPAIMISSVAIATILLFTVRSN